VDVCSALDVNDDGAVTIEELVAAYNNVLYGCGAGPTPNEFIVAGTITFWLRVHWWDFDSTFLILYLGPYALENNIALYNDHRYLRFLVSNSTGVDAGLGYDMGTWEADERHMVTLTWGDGTTVLYIDGAFIAANSYGTVDLGHEPPLTLGSSVPSGDIIDLQISLRALTTAQIAALFVQQYEQATGCSVSGSPGPGCPQRPPLHGTGLNTADRQQ